VKSAIYLLITLYLGLFFAAGLQAQPRYNMSNRVVDDCEGFLLDSDQGQPRGYYGHNENYTFSICIPGADRIEIDFTVFCLEPDYDYLRVFDGPDTLSTLLGYFTGEEKVPKLIARSGCMTINFISDPNVACHGWVAYWKTEFDIPKPIEILPIAPLACESSSMIITLAEPFPCDSLYASAFSIRGPIARQVTATRPIGCVGGKTTQVELIFSAPLDYSGRYQVLFTQYVGVCTSLYDVVSRQSFNVTGCPLNVVLTIEEGVICAGDSLLISAEASGGDPATYRYQWRPVSSGSPAIWVRPEQVVVYSVTVSDASGASAEATIRIEPAPRPRINFGDTTLCESIGKFPLLADPPSGRWQANGLDEQFSRNGLYDPKRVSGAVDTIHYEAPNGCAVRAIVEVIPLDKGTDDAACPGTPPFQVSGGLPEGGRWSGPFITPEGLFTPNTEPGSFEVTYTHPNGCAGTKWINIGDIALPDLDTLCQSDEPFEIEISPFGGIWIGPGILDRDLGLFDPHRADAGDKALIYRIHGCEDTLRFHIKEIYAGPNISACPAQAPFILPNWRPENGGGWWNGNGIVDSLSGLYDPSRLPSGFRDTLIFYANGCSQERVVWVQQTVIGRQEARACLQDEPLRLDFDQMRILPPGGEWRGPGITRPERPGAPWTFSPRQVGTGSAMLIYEANTCADTIMIDVFPNPQPAADSLCDRDGAKLLSVDIAGGMWDGPGITDRRAGRFDPRAAGAGAHKVIYRTEDGCLGDAVIAVSTFQKATLDSLEGFYCFQDRALPVTLSPQGGALYVDSLLVPSLNPASMGPGPHLVEYRVGYGSCADRASALVEIGEPIMVILDKERDSICYGQNYTLRAGGGGGAFPTRLTYEWNQGLGMGQNHYVKPTASTTYTVQVSDGCSDPASATLALHVHRPIYVDYSTGPSVCYDDTTWATVTVIPGALQDYSFNWNTSPVQTGPTVKSHPTTRKVTVTDLLTGCSLTEEIDLPGFPPIKANFGISPNQECISFLLPKVSILDFSVGARTGYWDFGDGSSLEPYRYGANLEHHFPDTGMYAVILRIENEGGCVSEFTRMVCVSEDFRVYAPNAFTPNGDGKNEVFKLVGVNIDQITWQVYNRYGQLVFQGNHLDDAWDGRYKGNLSPSGVYTYRAEYRTVHGRRGVMRGSVVLIY
jgi:gliding motility-associated-like protein